MTLIPYRNLPYYTKAVQAGIFPHRVCKGSRELLLVAFAHFASTLALVTLPTKDMCAQIWHSKVDTALRHSRKMLCTPLLTYFTTAWWPLDAP